MTNVAHDVECGSRDRPASDAEIRDLADAILDEVTDVVRTEVSLTGNLREVILLKIEGHLKEADLGTRNVLKKGR